MRTKSFLFSYLFIGLALLVSLTVAGCAPQINVSALSSGSLQTINDKPTVTFTLKTGMVDGKMAFIGVSGDLAGKVNPDLMVQPGDVVEIKLVNGDGALHDLTLEASGAATEQIAGQGKESSVKFKAETVGISAYYCSVPGHRQAGMEGRLVVGKVEQQAAVDNTVVRSPDDLPGPVARSTPQKVRIDLETSEVEAKLADGTSFVFWTFNGKVPGPFIRVRVGDTVEVHLKNSISSQMSHSIDFHAVTGPGGGAVATQTRPGEETSFTFKAMNPGLFVYHCATPMVAEHIANGMYGMILVEPEAGLAKVDREFYVMQGEIYTTEAMGTKGENSFDVKKLLDEDPEYFILNGKVGALTKDSPLKARTGETVRIFFGVGGPNFPSSFHVIGEIFDRVYDQGSLTAAPLTNVQTTLVPPGGAAMVEFKLEVPGRYILVDHALSRMERGLAGYLLVEGPEDHAIFDGKMTPGSGH
jgi:nitrite reductase (NO-forming)